MKTITCKGVTYRARRCAMRGPHAPHTWRGLNTRDAGYYCDGRPVTEPATRAVPTKPTTTP